MHRFHSITNYQKGRVKQYLLVAQKDPRTYTALERIYATREWNRQQRRRNIVALRARRGLFRLTEIDITMLNRDFWMVEWLLHTDPSIQRDVNRGLLTRLEGRYHHIRADIAEFFLQYAPLYGNNN